MDVIYVLLFFLSPNVQRIVTSITPICGYPMSYLAETIFKVYLSSMSGSFLHRGSRCQLTNKCQKIHEPQISFELSQVGVHMIRVVSRNFCNLQEQQFYDPTNGQFQTFSIFGFIRMKKSFFGQSPRCSNKQNDHY